MPAVSRHPDPPRGRRARPWGVRLGAAIPPAVAGGLLAAVFVGYVAGGSRLTPRVVGAAGWLLYELLACVYASVLPLGLLLVGLARRLARGRRASWIRDGTLLLLLPFAWLAWALAPAGIARWGLFLFLGLALARRVSVRHEASLVGDGASGIALAFGRLVRVWSLFTAAFLLSALLVLPIEPLLGLEMPDTQHGQVFILLGMGVVYFLLGAAFELVDLGRLARPPGLGIARCTAARGTSPLRSPSGSGASIPS